MIFTLSHVDYSEFMFLIFHKSVCVGGSYHIYIAMSGLFALTLKFSSFISVIQRSFEEDGGHHRKAKLAKLPRTTDYGVLDPNGYIYNTTHVPVTQDTL